MTDGSAAAQPGTDHGHPLSGVRAVEFAHVAAGPFAGMLLADLGADVIKVEPPGGDQMRGWPPFAENDDGESYSHNFASVNRNKRSVVADLKQPGDLARTRALCRSADVVIENYRPGALARLGLGFEQVSSGHRGIVYCSISGYGQTGPYAQRGAYDVVIQAMSGLMSVTGEPGGPPVKSGVPVADFVAGLYAALTVTALLPRARAEGRSFHVDCPMLDCLVAASALQTSEYWGSGKEPVALGSAHPRNAPYQGFQASDTVFVVAAGTDRLWREVCTVTGLQHLGDDPRFAGQRARVVHQAELARLLQERFRTAPAAHWLRELERRGVPCGPVNTFGAILHDDHVRATGLVQDMKIPVAGRVPTTVYPARISGVGTRLDLAPPVLGADTDEVWAMLEEGA